MCSFISVSVVLNTVSLSVNSLLVLQPTKKQILTHSLGITGLVEWMTGIKHLLRLIAECWLPHIRCMTAIKSCQIFTAACEILLNANCYIPDMVKLNFNCYTMFSACISQIIQNTDYSYCDRACTMPTINSIKGLARLGVTQWDVTSSPTPSTTPMWANSGKDGWEDLNTLLSLLSPWEVSDAHYPLCEVSRKSLQCHGGWPTPASMPTLCFVQCLKKVPDLNLWNGRNILQKN